MSTRNPFDVRPTVTVWSPLLNDRVGAHSWSDGESDAAWGRHRTGAPAGLPEFCCSGCQADQHWRCNGTRPDPGTATGVRGWARCLCFHPRNLWCYVCGDTRGGNRHHLGTECRWKPDPLPRAIMGAQQRAWRGDGG